MSDDWLAGTSAGSNIILNDVDGDRKLANKTTRGLRKGVIKKIDISGNVITYKLDAFGNVIRVWH